RRVVLAGGDEQVFRERELVRAEHVVRDGEQLLRPAFGGVEVRRVALAADREAERVHARGVDGADGVGSRDLVGGRGAGGLVDAGGEAGVRLRRPPGGGGGPDGVLPVVDAVHAQHREGVGEGGVAEVVTEGARGLQVVVVDGGGDDEVGVGGDAE